MQKFIIEDIWRCFEDIYISWDQKKYMKNVSFLK